MNGPPPEVRERRQRIRPRRGRHRDDVGEIVGGGIERLRVVVGPRVGIPGGGDEEDPPVEVGLDGVEQGLGEPAAAPAVAGGNDIDPAVLHELHILEAVDRIGSAPGARRAQELARHESDGPVDADDPDGVVPDRADRAGHMAAVAGVGVVHGVGIVVGGVDAEAVVHQAVAVVVDPVAVAIQLVAEHVRGQVRVSVVDPGIDHGHDDVAAPRGDVPRLGGVDVRIRDPAVLARVVEAPETAEAWIAGNDLGVDDPVGLRVEDVGTAPVEFDGVFDAHPGGNSHGLKAFDDPEALVRVGADQRVDERLVRRQRRGLEPHKNGVRSMPGCRLGSGAGIREEQRKQEQKPGQRLRARSHRLDAHRDGSSRRNTSGPPCLGSLIT